MTPQLQKFIDDHKLTFTAEFVPWSQVSTERKKTRRDPCLNWRVTLSSDGREILTTDYSLGQARTPQKAHKLIWFREACETGRCAEGYERSGFWTGKKIAFTDFDSFLTSLAMDAQVINCTSFEDWANDCGYDTDSRAAEKIYRACLDIALKLRAGLGNEAFEQFISTDWKSEEADDSAHDGAPNAA